MNLSEFRAICIARFGSAWQTKLAHHLGVNPRTVRRWAAGEVEVPPAVRAAMGALPRIARGYLDEWLLAADHEEKREYLIHLWVPRFVARIGEAKACDGLTFSLRDDGEEIFAFTWIDPPPHEDALRELLRGAQAALDLYSS